MIFSKFTCGILTTRVRNVPWMSESLSIGDIECQQDVYHHEDDGKWQEDHHEESSVRSFSFFSIRYA